MSTDDFETVPTGTMKELERLRQAVKAAYFEGWYRGSDSAPDWQADTDWHHSNARQDADL